MRLFALLAVTFLVSFLAAPGAPAAGSRGSRCASAAIPSASATIQISEVEADPVLAGTDTANEWFELTNVGTGAATLTGWTLTDSASADPLPTVSIGAGRCVVVAASASGFLAEHAAYAQPVLAIADGAIGNGLSNGGDLLTLQDASGAVVDCVAWGTATGCFSPAALATVANSSVTLQRASALDTDTATDWAAAGETPCATGPTAVRVTALRAARLGAGAVRLTWRAPVTTELAGFRIWRAAGSSTRYRRVSRRLIAARPNASRYSFVDHAVPGLGPLRYRLQLVLLDGRTVWAGGVSLHLAALSRRSPGS